MMHPQQENEFHFQRCSKCETVFLENPVAEEKLGQYYSKSYLPYRGAEAWGKYAKWVKSSQRKLDAKRLSVVKKALEKQTFSLLDIGCGKPTFLQLVKEKTKADCHGIDLSTEGWKNQEFDKLKLSNSSFADFRPKQKFDAITLWHYLEHDYHLQDTVKQISQSLKIGGKLIIEVPDYQSLTAKQQKQYWQGWHSPRHLSLLSRKGFEQLFPSSKWKIKTHKRYGTLDAFTLWWLGKMEEKKIDWATSMENEFWPLVGLKVLSFPFFLFEKFIPMGVQLLIIEKREQA